MSWQAPGLRSVAVGFVVLLGTLWAGSADAQSGESDSGVYLGVGGAIGFENFDTPDRTDANDGAGVSAWGGYKLNEWVALELQLEYVNGFDINGQFDADGQAVTFGGNLKVFPLAAAMPPEIQYFLKVGTGFSWYEFDIDDRGDRRDVVSSSRFGGGIDFYIIENVALQASATYVLGRGDVDVGSNDDLEDTDYVSLIFGLQYKF